MAYDGNRLSSVTDSGSEEAGTHSYSYDARGNLTHDGRKRLEFTHNVLNLPMSVRERDASGQHMTGGITYTYLGDGAAVVNLSAPQSASTGAFILEQNGYHPFGTKIDLGCNLSTNRWRYAGKEEQDIAEMDLRLLDFGARFYDPYTLRWNAVDPLAHKYFDLSPYNYCGNDPVNFFDPDGRKIEFSKNCSNDFKNKFKAAVDFMNKKGTSGKLAQLEKSSTVYYIADGRGEKRRNSFNSKTSTISWDPDSMFETDEGIYTSSTTILNHEIDHANEYDKNPEQVKKDNQPNSDEQFGTKEERRACENEQNTAEKHGEVKKGQKVRNSHSGGCYHPNCGVSPEEQSKACREHNDMLL